MHEYRPSAGSRGGEEEEGDEGCLEGTGGFEGPVDFRMGQVEEKRGRVASRKQVAGQEGEGEVVGDGENFFGGSPAGTPNFLRDSGEVAGGGELGKEAGDVVEGGLEDTEEGLRFGLRVLVWRWRWSMAWELAVFSGEQTSPVTGSPNVITPLVKVITRAQPSA